MTPQYYKTIFSLDIIDEVFGEPTRFSGYTAGELWNGWGTPLFPKEEADRLTEALNGLYANQSTFRENLGLAEGQPAAWYDAERDAYGTVSENEMGEIDWWHAAEINLDGNNFTVYPIGAYYWTWRVEK